MFGTSATFVIYPTRGFMGAVNVIVLRGANIQAIQALGATDRARFDLAKEVRVGPIYGAQEDLAKKQAPAEWKRGPSFLGISA